MLWQAAALILAPADRSENGEYHCAVHFTSQSMSQTSQTMEAASRRCPCPFNLTTHDLHLGMLPLGALLCASTF